MITLNEIWRYPIKSHSRERLDTIAITAGQSLPHDREWAIAHSETDADGTQWVPCRHFSIGSKAPALMAINSVFHWETGTITLTHPDRDDLTFDPAQNLQAIIDWTHGMIPDNRAQSARLVHATDRGMTDTDYPSISIGNLASHRALETEIGQPISHLRWRTNLWLDGLDPWAEFELIGKTIQIGAVQFDIREPVQRCLATTANPKTGARDVDTLSALNAHGHQNFTVYAVARTSGRIATGDLAEVL